MSLEAQNAISAWLGARDESAARELMALLYPQVARIARSHLPFRMEEADLLWIEEPVLPENIDGYRAVAAAIGTAIAGGEALGSLAAFRDFIAAGAFSIVQPDMTVCGGYTGFAKVAALAAAYDLPVMPHVFGTVIHQRAALQMAALIPARRGGGPAEFPYVEIDASDNPLLTLGGELEIAPDGKIAIPAAPGTGFDLDPQRLKPWLNESWRKTQ